MIIPPPILLRGSATDEYHLVAETIHGRRLDIVVTAMKDVEPSVVWKDVYQSLNDLTAESLREVDDSEESLSSRLFGFIFIFLVLWISVGFLFMLGSILVEAAGFIDSYETRTSPAWIWPKTFPMVGGEKFGTGMVRIWLLTCPVLLLITGFIKKRT